MTSLERTFKAFANKRRLAILKYLKTHADASVGELSDNIKLSFRSTSKHLGVLTAAEIVESEPRNRLVFYKLNGNRSSVINKLLGLI